MLRISQRILTLIALSAALIGLPANSIAGRISGSIFDPQGQLLREAMRVEISQNMNAWTSTITLTGRYQIDADMGGYVVRCQPVDPGSWYLTLYYPNVLSEDDAEWVWIPDQGETANINFNMIRGGKFSGAITPAEGGQFNPFSIMVLCYNDPDDIWNATGQFVVADPNQYSSPILPPGGYLVRYYPIPPDPHVPLFYPDTPYPNQAEPVQVEPGAITEDIDIQLPLGGSVSGTVRGNGELMQRSVIMAWLLGEDFVYPFGYAQSDQNGAYSIVGLPFGQFYILFSPSNPDFAPEWYRGAYRIRNATPVNIVAGQMTPNIDANLRRGAIFTGTIRSQANEPLTENEVGMELVPGYMDAGSDGDIVIDDQGVWRTENAVPPGPYAIDIKWISDGFSAQGFYPNVLHSWDAQWIFVNGGVETQPIDIRLARGGIVAGQITGPVGNPLEGAGVDLYDAFGEITDAWTWMDGRYAIHNIPVGSYYLSAVYYPNEEFDPDVVLPRRYSGGAISPDNAQRFNVTAGETTFVNLQLTRGGVLHADVLNQQGNPYQGFVNGVGIIPLAVTADGKVLWDAVSNNNQDGPPVVGPGGIDYILPPGRFTVVGFPLYIGDTRGAPNVRRTYPGGGYARNGATYTDVTAGSRASLSLRMAEEGFTVSGSARTIDNDPGMVVEIMLDADRELVSGYISSMNPWTLASGNWSIKGIPNGEYAILSTPMDEGGIIVSTWYPNVAEPGAGPEGMMDPPQNISRVRVNGADVRDVNIALQYVRNYTNAPDAGSRFALPLAFALYDAFPNPFNNQTALAFSLTKSARVSLKLFDTQGREIQTLSDRHFTAGIHSVQIDGKDLAGGVYFVKMKSGNFEATRKIALLK